MVPDLDAAQTRLQAWHGALPGDAAWRELESAQGLEQFVAAARLGGLRERFGPLSAARSLHELDRRARLALRHAAATIASWYPQSCSTALLAIAELEDLPFIVHRARGGALAGWMLEDESWHDMASQPAAAHTADAQAQPFEAWLARWRASWPRRTPQERAWDLLADELAMRLAAARAAGDAGRALLRRTLPWLFRRSAGTPVAACCELLRIALDLQRFRGGMARRLLAARAAAVDA